MLKKALVIFAIIFGASLILGSISFAVFDSRRVAESGANFIKGIADFSDVYETTDSVTVENFDFSEEYDDIEISIVSAKVEVRKSDDNGTHIVYKTNYTNPKKTVEIKNNTLIIKEEFAWNVTFFFVGHNEGHAEFFIELPEKEYDKFSLSTVSGEQTVEYLVADKLDIDTVSGNLDIKAFGKNIDINSVSGDCNVANCTDRRADKVSLSSTSGDYEISGYCPSEFKISSISGSSRMTEAAGKGTVSITSGYVDLTYAEWNNKLDLSAISGDINVTVPQGSGANLDYNMLSGEVRCSLGGTKVTFDEDGEATLGGPNIQDVEVSLTSGNVNIND